MRATQDACDSASEFDGTAEAPEAAAAVAAGGSVGSSATLAARRFHMDDRDGVRPEHT